MYNIALGANRPSQKPASVVRALTGELVPYVPPLGGAAVIGGAALLALTTTVLPIGRLLRTPAVEHIGVKE